MSIDLGNGNWDKIIIFNSFIIFNSAEFVSVQ